LQAFSGQQSPGQPIEASPETNQEGTLIFTGKVFDGTKAVADLTLHVGAKSLALQDGQVYVDTARQGRFTSGVEAMPNGEIVIAGFPLTGAGDHSAIDRPRFSRATLHFAANGKPARDAHKVFGTVKTAQGRVLTFEAKPLVLPRLPTEGRPAADDQRDEGRPPAGDERNEDVPPEPNR
jgi:hypothetical protein